MERMGTTFAIMKTAAGIMDPAVSRSVPCWHTREAAMIFSPPFFGRMTTAMVISATAWTSSVPILGTTAALMANAVLMVSNNRTGRDKSGHVLRHAASLLTNAVALLMNAASISIDAASRMANAASIMAEAASLERDAAPLAEDLNPHSEV